MVTLIPSEMKLKFVLGNGRFGKCDRPLKKLFHGNREINFSCRNYLFCSNLQNVW